MNNIDPYSGKSVTVVITKEAYPTRGFKIPLFTIIPAKSESIGPPPYYIVIKNNPDLVLRPWHISKFSFINQIKLQWLKLTLRFYKS